MKIVNLNEYNEGEGLRNKLRPKIDNFEPELPDSLWDRIHHEMDVRETNRKRKAVWWFSSVAVVVLASGIISFLLVNNASRPIELVIHQPQATSPVQKGTNNTSPQNKTNGGAETGVNTPNTTNTPTNTNGNGGNGNMAPSTLGTNNTQNGDLNAAPPIEAEQIIAPTNNTPIVDEPTTYNKETIPNAGRLEMKAGKLPVIIPVHEIVGVDLPSALANTFSPTQKTQRFFVGAYGEYNQTHRTAVTTSNLPGYPNAEERDRFEKKGFSPSYGVEFGFFPVKNLFIKSGIGMFSMSENVRYDVTKIIGGLAGAKDSLVEGTTYQTTNTYSYVQIPLEIGYTKAISKRFGIIVSGGASLNILKDYNYNFYEPIYGADFIQYKRGNSSYFKNFIALTGSAGMYYSLTKNWQFTGGVMYRRAVTSSTPTQFGVNVKPWSVGGRLGLAYKF